METLVLPHRPLLVVAGNLALDLANTVDEPGLPAEFDHLQDLGTTLAWAEQVGLVSQATRAELARAAREPDRAATEVRRLQRLRRAVGDVFGAVADQLEVPQPGESALRRAAGEALAAARLELRGDRMRPAWAIESPADLGRPIAYAAWDLLTAGPLQRVKRCVACPWLYLDQSKNGSRRWCTMEDCGKSAKMQRYVAKRAAARRSPNHQD
jgi:predicted RNA-binding Zn ribbon-like protein